MKKDIPLKIKILLFFLFVFAAITFLEIFNNYFILGGILYLQNTIAKLIYFTLFISSCLCIYSIAWKKQWANTFTIILFSIILIHEITSFITFYFLKQEIVVFIQPFLSNSLSSLSTVKTIFIVKKILATFLSTYVIFTSIKHRKLFLIL
jgi:hypothetical protein